MTQNFGRQGDTATFSLWDELDNDNDNDDLTPTFVVKSLQSISLVDTNISETIFSGLVVNPIWVQVSPTLIRWDISCRDWTYYADSIIVHGIFVGDTADNIIKDLVAQAGVGLTTNNVQPGPTINRIKINYLSLSAAITKVTKMATQTTNYGWFIDESKDVHFFNERQQSTPVASFTDNPDATYPTAIKGTYDAGSFSYNYDGQSIRNSCIVRGANYTGTRHDLFVGNGHQNSWPLTYPINTNAQGVATILTTLNSVPQSTQIINSPTEQSDGSSFQVSQAQNGQWFLLALSAPGDGAIINLQYPYQAPVIARVDNRTSQSTFGGSNNGVFQQYISDPAITSLSAAQARGQAELQQYQWVQERCSFATNENWYGHVRAGEIVTWSNQRVPDSQNGYNPGITGNFLVTQNTISGAQGNYRKYALTTTRVS